MSDLNAVVEYIFSTETTTTVIGQKLKQAAVKKNQPEKEEILQKEEEYRLIIREICKYDNSGNMCWVDYRSWMMMSKRLQNAMLELLAPKAWRGVVFHLDKWNDHERDVLAHLDKEIVLILARDQKKYRLHTIPLYKSYLDWMSPTKFKDLTSKISKTAIKTYGRASNMIYILDNNDNVEKFSIVS
jgi:hypothetical protein